MRILKYDLSKLMNVVLNAVNLLFLGYLIVFACACPTAALVGAVAFEVAFYAFLLSYRIWKSKQPKSSEQKQVEKLHEQWKTLDRFRTAYRVTVTAFALLAFIYLSIDLTALLFAKSGNLNLACAIYRAIALPPSPAVHPGFSMELLAGGYIESKQFKRAEPIVLAAENLRRSLVGEQDELIAGVYANLGDLYAKSQQYQIAENYYLRSIALSKQLHLPQGYGSPMTRLGTLYASERCFEKADVAFQDALAIRTKIFGAKSAKVSETLSAYATALHSEGAEEKAKLVEKQILVASNKSNSYLEKTVLPVAISATSLVVFWKRDRLLLLAATLLKSSRWH
ncbi:MAG: tetratricopeptide repeat protein [Cyanobacteria bacterium SZAS-4]|nr:tetratricopeptide repeat protein [Cyanobacteria bacterium SZAS-4]